MGYYNHRKQKEGFIFSLKDNNDFSPNWMNVVTSDGDVQYNTKEEFLKAYKDAPIKSKKEKVKTEIDKKEQKIDNTEEVI